MRQPPLKIVVFDLDETLGCFVELGMFWDAITDIYKKEPPVEFFFKVLDLYPEFFRPDIYKILRYLRKQKSKGICTHVMIYTNNQGERSWTEKIAAYLNHKVNTKLFDQIIAAFKVRGKVVEVCRTSHDKSVKDLLRCTRLPKNTEICFLDDQFHPLMEDDRVYYINAKPYTQSLTYKDMAERFYNAIEPSIDKDEFIKNVESHMSLYGYSVIHKEEDEIKVDAIISKHILEHLKEFFQA